MKRKVVLMLVVAMFAVIMAFAFVACDEESGSGSGTGDRIFTEDATYDGILTAFKNAESITVDYYADGILLHQYMLTSSSSKIYDLYVNGDNPYGNYTYVYPANGYYYNANKFDDYSQKFYDIYIDTFYNPISIKNWFDVYFVFFLRQMKMAKSQWSKRVLVDLIIPLRCSATEWNSL